MARKGSQPERWLCEVAFVEPTVNSGATFCDADALSLVGRRIYESKSTEREDGLIQGKDVKLLFQRGERLQRTPVFLFSFLPTRHRFVIVPRDVWRGTDPSWDSVTLRWLPDLRGETLRAPWRLIGEAMDEDDEVVYVFSSARQKRWWALMDAKRWLRLCGDLKS